MGTLETWEDGVLSQSFRRLKEVVDAREVGLGASVGAYTDPTLS
jgi:hypothetical protein